MSVPAIVNSNITKHASNHGARNAGSLPEGWDASTLGSLCATSSGTTPPRRMHERYYRNGPIPWVKTLDLNNSEIFSTEESVTDFALQETSLQLNPPGSVLVAMYGG